MSEHHQPQATSKDFNYRITEYFLKNTRVTIISLIAILVLGLASILFLKTTGFPSPSVNIAFVQTTYFGASAQTVERDITEPIENVIKEVEGVDTFISYSQDSFSNVVVYLNSNANIDTVSSKLDGAIRSISLPSEASNPVVSSPKVGGTSMIFSIVNENPAEIFRVFNQIKINLNQLPETSSVQAISGDISRKVVITLDINKMRAKGITVDNVKAKIATVGEVLPAVSGVELDNQNSNIITATTWQNLEDIQNIEFSIAPPAIPTATKTSTANKTVGPTAEIVKLSSFATLDLEYFYKNNLKPQSAFSSDEQNRVLTALPVQVKVVEGTDLSLYNQEFQAAIKKIENVNYFDKEQTLNFDENKVQIIVGFDQQTDNQKQVDEVLGGLFGSPLSINNQFLAQFGWLLGGIQLVFLVMLAFVSWRSAIISALAIPISLVFSTIYLFLIGENLNTMVLFSLVLVIGLVVDPTLVVLESIQRKIDIGLKGKTAALAAIKDVGPGVFLAALTNIIVFTPFGLISGILGQIFQYLPLTIIPAIVGSYIVPLIFLAWLGGLFLKRNKKSTDNEEKNLWLIAKWTIKFNHFILSKSWLSVLVIVVALILPLLVAGFYISSGLVKTVQFSSLPNGDVMSLSGNFLPDMPADEQISLTADILNTVVADSDVVSLVQSGSGLRYYVNIKPPLGRSKTTVEIANNLDQKLRDQYGSKLFNISMDAISYGPPASQYQIALAIKEKDSEKLEKASRSLAKVFEQVCVKPAENILGSTQISITENCDGERVVEKVDDGYTNKQNSSIEILVDPNLLQNKGLFIQNAPASLLINQTIKNQFEVNNSKKVGEVDIDGEQVEIILEQNVPDPLTLDEIKNTKITAPSGQTLTIGDISTISQKPAKATIQRVKGETLSVIQASLKQDYADQATAGKISSTVLNFLKENEGQKSNELLGISADKVDTYSEGSQASFVKSFVELLTTLVLAIIASYFVLAIFFKSMTQPIVILFTIPLTFLGIFPALAHLSNGEFGFLEIIGVIILIGIVENVAIFLIDAANQKIQEEGWDIKKAIVYASGVRLRPVLLSNITAIVSLAPLAIFSQGFRSISLVIIFGLITSGIVSLITTPILFVAFKWLSQKYHATVIWNKFLFILLPIFGILTIFIPSMSDVTTIILRIAATLLICAPVMYIGYWLVKKPKSQN